MANQDGFGGQIEAATNQLEMTARAIIQAMPAAVQAGAEVLQQRAVEMAPKQTMELANSAGNRPDEENDPNMAVHKVYFDAPHAIVQEFGIKVARILPKRQKSLRLGGPGGDHAKGVPPGRTQAYLRPAAENNQQEIEAAIRQVLERKMDNAIVQYRGVLSGR